MVTNAIGGQVKLIGKIEFFSKFSPPMQDELAEKLCDESGVAGMVCYENLQMDSSEFGKRSAYAFGPGMTYASAAQLVANAPVLGDVPSRFQYPTCYCLNRE